jgi:heptosyltransferase-1
MNKILVIRVGRAGDMIMITPALLAILDNYPDHEIHLLTSADGKRVLNGFNEKITKIYIYKSGGIKKYLERLRINKQIRNEGYEYIFNFEMKPSYKRVYFGLGILSYELDDSKPHLNYAKRCLDVVQRAVGSKIKNYWDWLPVTEEGMSKAKQQLLDVGIAENDFVIGIHPSFSGSKKGLFSSKNRNYLREWPTEYFAEVINMLAKYSGENRLNIKIVIDLLPDEKMIGEKIVENAGNNVVLFTLQPDFQRYKALIKRMNLLITPDTGPMHIAAAVGTRNICLFSGKSPEDCGPYMNEVDYIALRSEDYGDSNLGLRAIKPEHVFRECIQYLPNPL